MISLSKNQTAVVKVVSVKENEATELFLTAVIHYSTTVYVTQNSAQETKCTCKSGVCFGSS